MDGLPAARGDAVPGVLLLDVEEGGAALVTALSRTSSLDSVDSFIMLKKGDYVKAKAFAEQVEPLFRLLAKLKTWNAQNQYFDENAKTYSPNHMNGYYLLLVFPYNQKSCMSFPQHNISQDRRGNHEVEYQNDLVLLNTLL